MDHPRSTPYSLAIVQCSKSTIPPLPINGTTQDSHIPKGTTSPSIRQCTPPILRLPRHLRTAKRRRTTSISPLGPCHQVKARGPSDSHQKNNPTLPNQASQTLQIPERTHSPRNDTTIEEPLHYTILLHQKEEWEALPSPRLPTSQHMDHQKPIPPPSYPTAN